MSDWKPPCDPWERALPKVPEPPPPPPPPAPRWVSTCVPITPQPTPESSSASTVTLQEELQEVEVEEEEEEEPSVDIYGINRAELREAFTLIDQDQDGLVDIAELADVVRAMGQHPKESDIERVTAEYKQETCGRGNFTVAGARDLVRRLWVQPDDAREADELIEAFRRLDRPGSGFVNGDLLRHLLTTLGEPLAHEEIDSWYSDIDSFFTGSDIAYEGVCNFMLSK